jgi:hypothetical protein
MKDGQASAKKDDFIRGFLVVYTTSQALLLILFFGTIPFLRFHIGPDESLGIVELVLPMLTGYIGLMLGYYYGTKAKST